MCSWKRGDKERFSRSSTVSTIGWMHHHLDLRWWPTCYNEMWIGCGTSPWCCLEMEQSLNESMLIFESGQRYPPISSVQMRRSPLKQVAVNLISIVLKLMQHLSSQFFADFVKNFSVLPPFSRHWFFFLRVWNNGGPVTPRVFLGLQVFSPEKYFSTQNPQISCECYF